jgi:hypothetical protein
MRRLPKRLGLLILALALVSLAVVVNPQRAFACDCRGITSRRALAESDAVFRGTVERVDEIRGKQTRVDIRFAVDRVYKGTVYEQQVVASAPDPATCGLVPEPGSGWIIFATESIEGSSSNPLLRLRTTVCSGNLSTTGNPPAVLGAGIEPRPGASDRAERATGTDQALTRGLVIAGVGGLGLLALIGIGLAYLWRPGRRT